MIGLALLFMSGVTAASPTTPLPWFTNDDYPVQAFERRKEGTTAFEVLVAPDGRPAACSIDQSAGYNQLDQRACLVAMRTARFRPALGPNGEPAYGVYRTKVNWALDPENWNQMELGPDIELTLSKLPQGTTAPIDVKFAYLVNTDGKVSGCTAVGPAHPAVLDDLGCQRLLSDVRLKPVSLPKQGVVSAVRTSWVRFAPGN